MLPHVSSEGFGTSLGQVHNVAKAEKLAFSTLPQLVFNRPFLSANPAALYAVSARGAVDVNNEPLSAGYYLIDDKATEIKPSSLYEVEGGDKPADGRWTVARLEKIHLGLEVLYITGDAGAVIERARDIKTPEDDGPEHLIVCGFDCESNRLIVRATVPSDCHVHAAGFKQAEFESNPGLADGALASSVRGRQVQQPSAAATAVLEEDTPIIRAARQALEMYSAYPTRDDWLDAVAEGILTAEEAEEFGILVTPRTQTLSAEDRATLSYMASPEGHVRTVDRRVTFNRGGAVLDKLSWFMRRNANNDLDAISQAEYEEALKNEATSRDVVRVTTSAMTGSKKGEQLVIANNIILPLLRPRLSIDSA
jgi:hypothetical protein